MNDFQKLNQLLTDIDSIEDFIKLSAIDFKIDKQTGNELLRMISEAKNRALK